MIFFTAEMFFIKYNQSLRAQPVNYHSFFSNKIKRKIQNRICLIIFEKYLKFNSNLRYVYIFLIYLQKKQILLQTSKNIINAAKKEEIHLY